VDPRLNNNFGLRLRALIHGKGLDLEQAWAALGISRATLFNWLKRQNPPPQEKHQDLLASFFGNEPREYVLFGVYPSKTNAYADRVLSAEARHLFETTMKAAEQDPARLGWIVEQLRLHLRPPHHWNASYWAQANRDLDELMRVAEGDQPIPQKSPEASAG
jgi:transcriptional regulator with XRE-family HTH domain